MSKEKHKKGARAEAGKDRQIIRLEEQLAAANRMITANKDEYMLNDRAKDVAMDAVRAENARLTAAVQALTVQPAAPDHHEAAAIEVLGVSPAVVEPLTTLE